MPPRRPDRQLAWLTHIIDERYGLVENWWKRIDCIGFFSRVRNNIMKKRIIANAFLFVGLPLVVFTAGSAVNAQISLKKCYTHTETAKSSVNHSRACQIASRHVNSYVGARPGCRRDGIVGRRTSMRNLPIGGGRTRPAYICKLTVRICCMPVMRAPSR